MSSKETAVTQPSASRPGFVRRLWLEQKEMAFGKRHKEFLAETSETLRRVKNLKIQPTRVESFEAAVARQRLTPAMLEMQLRRYKGVHLALYGIAGMLVVYALYLALNFNVYFGLGAFMAAVGSAVNGYLHGFRAWQIEHRHLIKLQDAVRIPATYLVL